MNAAQPEVSAVRYMYDAYLVFSISTDRFLVADSRLNMRAAHWGGSAGWIDSEPNTNKTITSKDIPQGVLDATGLPLDSVIDVFSCFWRRWQRGDSRRLHLIVVANEFNPAPTSGREASRWTKDKRYTKDFHSDIDYCKMLIKAYRRELQRTDELIARLEAGGANDD